MRTLLRKVKGLFIKPELPIAEPFDVWFNKKFPPTLKLENAEEIHEALTNLQKEVHERTKPYD